MAFSAWMQRVYSVLVVPLLNLCEEFLLILWGVGDVVHARQRLVQLGDLILIVRFLLGRIFQATVPASRRKVWKLAQGMSVPSKNSLAFCRTARMSQAMKST